MNQTKDKKNGYIEKLEILKQINDIDVKNLKLDRFNIGENDVFSQMVELFDSLILNSESDSSTSLDMLKNITVDSISECNEIFKETIKDNILTGFSIGSGICGEETIVPSGEIRIKPADIDYMDILRMDPESNNGKIYYESSDELKQKVNRGLYDTFSGTNYNFITNGNSQLFGVTWDNPNQEFVFNLGVDNMEVFVKQYFSSITIPNKENILKNTLSTCLKGENSVISYNKKVINVSDILDGIFKNCNTNSEEESNESFIGTQTEFIDESGMFNFDEVEGFNVDDLRYDSISRYSTCYDFEIETKDDIIDEIFYFSDVVNQPINEIINESIDKISKHTSVSSNYELNIPNVKIGVLKDFILNLPKTLMRFIFTPKILLPIVILYKKIKGEANLKTIFTVLKKMFINIIKKMFWFFVDKIWKKVKQFLLKTLKKIGVKFLKNNAERRIGMVTNLMNLIGTVPLDVLENCNSLYDLISKTIDSLINKRNYMSIPNSLLSLSDGLNGYSKDRATMKIVELLNNSGINTGPIYGEQNNLVKIVNSIVDGNMSELDENGYVKIVLKPAVLPSTMTATTILPGVVTGVGKIF